jgi:hypothetical protein
MDFFQACGKGESFREDISRFRASGMTTKLARNATGGILMPTKSLIKHVDLQKFETIKEEETVETCVEESVAFCMNACIIEMITSMPIMEI